MDQGNECRLNHGYVIIDYAKRNHAVVCLLRIAN